MINRYYIKPGGIDPTKKVYYNRPLIQNVTSYATYDEGWMYANNYDPAFFPSDGVLQMIDPSVSVDYLKYYNAFGHKFRFTGLTGGYYDFNTASYKDVNGSASTFATEFATPAGATSPDGYIIDHLTGIAWRSIRGGAGGINWNNMWITGILPFAGFNDWYIPTYNYIETLQRLDLTAVLSTLRPPFQFNQQYHWVNNTTPNSSLNGFQFDAFNGQMRVVVKTSTGSGNRTFSRLHYSRTDYVLQP